MTYHTARPEKDMAVSSLKCSTLVGEWELGLPGLLEDFGGNFHRRMKGVRGTGLLFKLAAMASVRHANARAGRCP